ncbi:hypothetical protein ACFSKI_15300 [Pseudogracilibacillus auburnensis]|uniref:Uncharacterized protein n=1 Tax=Pseudogracilibacillus auburnensis TaxID=1494959 RepID=A0A2V3VL01_9BACI|nr:hypothetical protein [Pseudogracilibacillus auburnensis]MBO1001411.1 hypothetical protein [Pseudogracilibacillus auburnensis]PXW82496.1 hypothetical protein DFR56_11872 [Pseudogracilibacillus auburnensis]
MKVDLKFYGYQILGVLIIWLGMTFFLKDIEGAGKLIYYVVTSWLLFLIVLTGKKFISDRKEKNDESR